ncbi:MAG TPA: hypothetical protein VHK90_08390, partial [Thermoanaerobaculia bacterium]|nr:hypothetical protein [Thermoanaerobaculia bacterium]
MAIPLAGMAVFFFWQWMNDGITPKEAVRLVETKAAAPLTLPSPPGGEGTVRQEALPRVTPKKARHRGDIVLIID